MSEMVERVARALCRDAGDDPDREYIGMDNNLTVGWKLHARPARAAIEAMREPTPDMLEAFYANVPRGRAANPLDHWHAMIEAALE